MDQNRVHVLPLIFDLDEDAETLEESLGLDRTSFTKMMMALDGSSHSVLLNLLRAREQKKIDDPSIIFLLTLGALTFFDMHIEGWRLSHTNPDGGPDAYLDDPNDHHSEGR